MEKRRVQGVWNLSSRVCSLWWFEVPQQPLSSTVFNQVQSQCDDHPGDFTAFHASVSQQALWTGPFPDAAGFSTCPQTITKWAANSPDLNLMENLQNSVKKKMGAGAVICGTKPQPSVVNILIISYSTFLIETFNFNCNYYRIFKRFLFETKLQKKTKNLFPRFF